MREAIVVFRKELKEALRDKRSLMAALIFPVVGPLMIFVMFTNLAKTLSGERMVDVSVVGADQAPALVEHIETQRVRVVHTQADADHNTAIAEGTADAVLIIPDDYAENFREGTPAPIELLFDDSRQGSNGTILRIRRAIIGYSGQIGAFRLLARGIDPGFSRPIDLRETNLARQRGLVVQLLSMLPMLVLMSAFMGGMFVAMDTTAGERERSSLEPLLCTPVSRTALVVGKWSVAFLFATSSLILMLSLSVVALAAAPLAELGIVIDFGVSDFVGILLAVVPVALFATAAEMLVATFSRSFKEAQTHVSMFMILPMAPAIWLSMTSLQLETWLLCIPALGQDLLLIELLRGEPPSMIQFATAGLASACLGLVCVYFNARMFEREKVVFGRS